MKEMRQEKEMRSRQISSLFLKILFVLVLNLSRLLNRRKSRYHQNAQDREKKSRRQLNGQDQRDAQKKKNNNKRGQLKGRAWSERHLSHCC
jgi:hypothetical protein